MTTSLRFVGDVPVWLGILLSMIVGGLAWRYYRRESFHLPGRLKWCLPLLRAVAFFLGIMIFTGPVLHHRKTIGEPGRVKIYLDRSESMLMQDRHMSTLRKLRIASELGWLKTVDIDTTQKELVERFRQVRQEFEETLGSSNIEVVKEPEFAKILDVFQDEASQIQKQYAENLRETDLWESLMTHLSELRNEDSPLQSKHQTLKDFQAELLKTEKLLQQNFETELEGQLKSGDDSFRAAVSLFDASTRLRRAELALADSARNIIAELQKAHEVEVFLLEGDKVQSLPLGEIETAFSQRSITQQNDFRFHTTDLSTGITETHSQRVLSSEDSNSQQETVVVLLTDGQHNSGPSPLQTAKVLGGQGVKFFNVSYGATRQADDLAVIRVESPELVFKTDQVRGSVTFRDTMSEKTPFVLQIQHGENVLWEQELVTQNALERRVEFEFPIESVIDELNENLNSSVVQHAIPVELVVSIVPLSSEFETQNNQKGFRLAAITHSYKLLLLDGRSRWETRYLKNVFDRDEQWDVTTVISGPGTDDQTLPRGDQQDQFPTTREALFEYDLVILGEISRDLFQSHEIKWLKEFVEIRGGGIVLVDGQRGKLREWAEQGLQSLIPVEFQTSSINLPPKSLQLTDRGASMASLKLTADDLQNRKFWTELPPPHMLVPVTATPGTEVLVEANFGDANSPAIVTRKYGAGRVLYFAFDETWRWRYKAADLWHQRIWNQLATYVMPRPYSVSDDFVSIDTGPVSYQSGDSVEIRVQLRNVDGKPAAGSTVDALISKNGKIESTVPLEADLDVPGVYRGRSSSLPAGEYQVSVRASGMSDSALKAQSQFLIEELESGEMIATNANDELLTQMSEATGGILIREEEINRLPELLQPFSHGRIIQSETLIWQSYWWFAAMMLLLTLEWALRKRAGLL